MTSRIGHLKISRGAKNTNSNNSNDDDDEKVKSPGPMGQNEKKQYLH